MKRSEMIKKIALDLDDIITENYYWQKDSEWCANLILMSMEESGMLPPERKAEPKDFANLGFDQEFLDEHDMKVNEWEPEDE